MNEEKRPESTEEELRELEREMEQHEIDLDIELQLHTGEADE